MVHPAVHPRDGDHDRQQDRERPDYRSRPPLPESRAGEKREPAIDDDRCSDVTGREALIYRQVIETQDRRPLAVHEQARDPVGRDLDKDRAQDEGDDPPAPRERGARCGQDHERRNGGNVTDRGAHVRRVVQRSAAVTCEPPVRQLVRVPDGVDRQQQIHDEQADTDRDRGENRVSDERHQTERGQRRRSQPRGEQARPRISLHVEDRCRIPVTPDGQPSPRCGRKGNSEHAGVYPDIGDSKPARVGQAALLQARPDASPRQTAVRSAPSGWLAESEATARQPRGGGVTPTSGSRGIPRARA